MAIQKSHGGYSKAVRNDFKDVAEDLKNGGPNSSKTTTDIIKAAAQFNAGRGSGKTLGDVQHAMMDVFNSKKGVGSQENVDSKQLNDAFKDAFPRAYDGHIKGSDSNDGTEVESAEGQLKS